mgnify:CR=1 FL=1
MLVHGFLINSVACSCRDPVHFNPKCADIHSCTCIKGVCAIHGIDESVVGTGIGHEFERD